MRVFHPGPHTQPRSSLRHVYKPRRRLAPSPNLILLVPQAARKASTRKRYSCRSAARLVMVSHVRPYSFIYLFFFFWVFSTVRLQVSFGRPGLRLPPAAQRKAVLGNASEGIQYTCTNHLHLRLLILVSGMLGLSGEAVLHRRAG